MLLAELSLLPGTIFTSTMPSMFRTVLAGILITLGLYFASYPELKSELTPWSNQLANIAESVFPEGVEKSRLWTSLGAISALYGVMLSSTAQGILSHPLLCRLGKLSLAIFLIHVAVLRTVFIWILYGVFSRTPVNEKGVPIQGAAYPLPSKPYQVFASIITVGVVLYAANLWHIYIEPWFVWGADKIDEYTFAQDNTVVLPPPAQSPMLLTPSESLSTTSTCGNDDERAEDHNEKGA